MFFFLIMERQEVMICFQDKRCKDMFLLGSELLSVGKNFRLEEYI